jgi:hypothetical protein
MSNPWYAPATLPGLNPDEKLVWPPNHSQDLTGGLPLVTKSRHPFLTRQEATNLSSDRKFNWKVFDLTNEADAEEFVKINNEGINGVFCHIVMRRHFFDEAKPENVKVYMEWLYHFKSDTRTNSN